MTHDSLQWQCQTFKQLNTAQLYEILRLRVNVFVVEQNCPYAELDGKDCAASAYHLFACNNHTMLAYARLLGPGIRYPQCSIGRLLVADHCRRRGLGTQLMNKCLEHITLLWPQQDIRLSAQAHLQSFYEAFAFQVSSQPYLEDGIEHIEMFKPAT